MHESAFLQQYLAPLAGVFNQPDKKDDALLRAVLDRGNEITNGLFVRLRKALGDASSHPDPIQLHILSGLMGTSVTLMEAVLSSGALSPGQRDRLCALIRAYRDMLEDMELFSADIPASDCLLAASQPVSCLNTPEEDAAWRDL